jgi:DNA-directed RNA polymerase specialized sigma24 family protein
VEGTPAVTREEPWFAREDFAVLYPRLRRFAAIVGSLDIEPDDLVQDALSAMLRRADVPDNAEAFLRRSIANAAISGGRRHARWHRRLPMVARRDGELDSYPSDLRMLETLTPRARAAVWLVDVEGWPTSDAASLLGVRDAALRQQLSRARARLRRDLFGTEEA